MDMYMSLSEQRSKNLGFFEGLCISLLNSLSHKELALFLLLKHIGKNTSCLVSFGWLDIPAFIMPVDNLWIIVDEG